MRYHIRGCYRCGFDFQIKRLFKIPGTSWERVRAADKQGFVVGVSVGLPSRDNAEIQGRFLSCITRHRVIVGFP